MHRALFFATTLNILFSERRTQLLTGTEVVKAAHGFKHSVAMRTKPINPEAVNFLLSACCKETFNFTIRSCTLKKRRPYFQSCGSCFVEVRIYSFLNRNSNACKDRSAWVDTSSRDIVGWHQFQQ